MPARSRHCSRGEVASRVVTTAADVSRWEGGRRRAATAIRRARPREPGDLPSSRPRHAAAATVVASEGDARLCARRPGSWASSPFHSPSLAASRAEEPPPVLMDEQEVRLPRTGAGADPTAAATVVEASRFAGEAKDVAGLVATSPGVAVNDYGGLGQLTTVSIRGSTADGVLVLLDGLPLNTAFGGAVDLSSIPRGWIERIEVLRGPEGALYGAGALGGVVNVITRRTAAGQWSAEGTGGSFGTALALRRRRGGDGWAARCCWPGAPTPPGATSPTSTTPPPPSPAIRWSRGCGRTPRPGGPGRWRGSRCRPGRAARRRAAGLGGPPRPARLRRQPDPGRLAARRTAPGGGPLRTRPWPAASPSAAGSPAGSIWLDVRVGDPVPVRAARRRPGRGGRARLGPRAGPALGAALHRGRVGRRARPPGRPHPLVDRRGRRRRPAPARRPAPGGPGAAASTPSAPSPASPASWGPRGASPTAGRCGPAPADPSAPPAWPSSTSSRGW